MDRWIFRRGSQVVRQRSAKPLFVGSIPTRAFGFINSKAQASVVMDRPGPKPRLFECREDLFWYLVGLIATDGCLLSNRRAVVVTSKSEDFLLKLRDSLGLVMKIHRKRSGYTQAWGYDLVMKRVDLYEKLERIGLAPRKSATIGPLDVPDSGFADFLRGVIDGDGCIYRWIHPTNGREQWAVHVTGISRPFLQWLRETIGRIWGVEGRVHTDPPRDKNHHTKYSLKYGKLAAKAILTECYYPGAFALDRKAELAAGCIKTSVGWSKSGTVSRKESWKDWRYQRISGTGTVSRVLDSAMLTTGGVGICCSV